MRRRLFLTSPIACLAAFAPQGRSNVSNVEARELCATGRYAADWVKDRAAVESLLAEHVANAPAPAVIPKLWVRRAVEQQRIEGWSVAARDAETRDCRPSAGTASPIPGGEMLTCFANVPTANTMRSATSPSVAGPASIFSSSAFMRMEAPVSRVDRVAPSILAPDALHAFPVVALT